MLDVSAPRRLPLLVDSEERASTKAPTTLGRVEGGAGEKQHVNKSMGSAGRDSSLR